MLKKILIFLMGVILLSGANDLNESKFKSKIDLSKKLDPVYRIDVTKNPRFNAFIELADGTKITFCCPKAMFDLYLRPYMYREFKIKKESDFKKLYVTDYLTGKKIDAKKALYIFGSKLVGPKGDDLIPVKDETTSQLFRLKYGGSRVLTFGEVVKKGMGLIKYLDMP